MLPGKRALTCQILVFNDESARKLSVVTEFVELNEETPVIAI